MKNIKVDNSSGINIKQEKITIKKSNFVFGIVIVSILILALAFLAFILPNMKSSDAKIIGDWEYQGYTFFLYSDGTFQDPEKKICNYRTGKYTILDDNRLKLTSLLGDTQVLYFSVTSDTLTLSFTKDGDSIVFKRSEQ